MFHTTKYIVSGDIPRNFPIFSVFESFLESSCEAYSYMHLTGSLIVCLCACLGTEGINCINVEQIHEKLY